MAIKRYFLCLVSLLIVLSANCAPKSKKSDHSPHTLYDQKQTGDYNIQLHLKDFQIIAVLSDDDSSGDYDYDYDYSDFTVKPVTQKPTEIASPASTPLSVVPSSTAVPEKPASTLKPSNHPYPILLPSTESPKEKEPTKNEEISVSTEGAVTKESTPKQSAEPSKETATSTAKTPRKEETGAPGQIKVQILETPPSVSIVPGEDVHDANGNLPQGELQLKRCASGFSRDKRGRCRRVRRPASPQLQYGFSRLASDLASRFRQIPSDNSSSSSESTED